MLLQNPTIGVFDSGFGGLTVLRALLPLIPAAQYVYLGDTARLPYGSKSHDTIARYAVSSAKFLQQQGADLLVIACNTASALALDDIRQAVPIPVVGVIHPGAEAAYSVSATEAGCPIHYDGPIVAMGGNEQPLSPEQDRVPHLRRGFIAPKVGSSADHSVLVLATTATIQSHAYAHALSALGMKAIEKACPLLVPLVEEGWSDHPVTAEVLRIYFREAFAEAPNARTLVLGCTHYPLLQPLIQRVLAELNHPMTIIDSAAATAACVAAYFPASSSSAPATCRFYATDSIEKFQRLGSTFLGQPLSEVYLLDLGG
ncbi:MAG TPA: aspartate/glutamate racemase family protein [Edaphobacter sp.]|nr:aspartate/glutamate racemase family protein [Edaphobacter sp.]